MAHTRHLCADKKLPYPLLMFIIPPQDMVSLGKEYGVKLKVRKKRKGKCGEEKGLKVETEIEEPKEVAGAAASAKETPGDGISPLASRSPTPSCSSSAKRSPPPSLLASETSPHGFVSISMTASPAAGGEAAAAIASEAEAGGSAASTPNAAPGTCAATSVAPQPKQASKLVEPNFFKPTRCSEVNNSSSNPSSPKNATPRRKSGSASQRKKKTPARTHESPLPHFMTPRSELDASPSCNSNSISALEAMLEKEKEVRRSYYDSVDDDRISNSNPFLTSLHSTSLTSS